MIVEFVGLAACILILAVSIFVILVVVTDPDWTIRND